MNRWGFSGDGNYKKVSHGNDRNKNISDIKDPLRKLSDMQGLTKFYLGQLLENTLHQDKWVNQKKRGSYELQETRAPTQDSGEGNCRDNDDGRFRSDILRNVSCAPGWAYKRVLGETSSGKFIMPNDLTLYRKDLDS